MVGPPQGNGSIDVTRGGGEFGQGFYTQDSRSNAMTWVQNRFPQRDQPCVLELSIDDLAYSALRILTLNQRQAQRLTRRLRKAGTVRTHQEGVDVVVGPLNGSAWNNQQKFESATAEGLLNGPTTQRRIV
jgi:hypothetical protein